jgi:hypothetical protein
LGRSLLDPFESGNLEDDGPCLGKIMRTPIRKPNVTLQKTVHGLVEQSVVNVLRSDYIECGRELDETAFFVAWTVGAKTDNQTAIGRAWLKTERFFEYGKVAFYTIYVTGYLFSNPVRAIDQVVRLVAGEHRTVSFSDAQDLRDSCPCDVIDVN